MVPRPHGHSIPAAKPAQDEDAADLDKFLDNVCWAVHEKIFATTKGLRMGLVPEWVNENYLIAVLLGCSVPLVLRPVGGSGGGDFEIIGDAYVHGIMDGEVIENLEYKAQTIILV